MPLKPQPDRSTAVPPVLASSRNSSPSTPDSGLYMISLITTSAGAADAVVGTITAPVTTNTAATNTARTRMVCTIMSPPVFTPLVVHPRPTPATMDSSQRAQGPQPPER